MLINRLALEARGLTVVRGHKIVVRDLDLDVSAGTMVALCGSNGAGKTTLLHCLAGVVRPARGEVRWFGEPAAQSAAARQSIGFLGHDSGIYPTLTARENLRFAGRMYGVPDVVERADHLLATAGLERHRDQLAGQLSRGQRQRLAIARAILHKPKLLLLDEPFTNLDAEGSRWLREFLEQLRAEGCALLVASHTVEQSACDRVVVLERGNP